MTIKLEGGGGGRKALIVCPLVEGLFCGFLYPAARNHIHINGMLDPDPVTGAKKSTNKKRVFLIPKS